MGYTKEQIETAAAFIAHNHIVVTDSVDLRLGLFPLFSTRERFFKAMFREEKDARKQRIDLRVREFKKELIEHITNLTQKCQRNGSIKIRCDGFFEMSNNEEKTNLLLLEKEYIWFDDGFWSVELTNNGRVFSSMREPWISDEKRTELVVTAHSQSLTSPEEIFDSCADNNLNLNP